MFCPKCKYEYREGFKVCSDCGVLLVETLPSEIQEKKKCIFSKNSLKVSMTNSLMKKLILCTVLLSISGLCIFISVILTQNKPLIVEEGEISGIGFIDGAISGSAPFDKVLDVRLYPSMNTSHFYCNKSTKYFEMHYGKSTKINFEDLTIGQYISVVYDNSEYNRVYKVVVNP